MYEISYLNVEKGQEDWEAIVKKVLDKCFEKKLIIELAGSYDSVLKIMPSLVIEDELLLKDFNKLYYF